MLKKIQKAELKIRKTGLKNCIYLKRRVCLQVSLSLKFALCVQVFSYEPEWLGIFILKPEPKLSKSPGTDLKEECQLLEDKRFHDKV